jgi:hypothetical protein
MGLYPPIWAGVRKPVNSTRFTQLIAAVSLTPNRTAAPRRLIPSTSTASITRSRKSCEYAIPC